MSGRAGSAASSQAAKQRLVRLLFSPRLPGQGREAHRRLDHSIYSHTQLKSAYLEAAHEFHPDKLRCTSKNDREKANTQFAQLQDAWRNYNEFAKLMQRVEGNRAEANFVIFGVGCSFSDNEQERAARNDIMDQASRGWFAAGSLSADETETAPATINKETRSASCARQDPSLLTDDELALHDNDSRRPGNKNDGGNDVTPPVKRPKKTLVLIPPTRQ